MEASPKRWQPSFPAKSRRVCFMAVYCRLTRQVCTTRNARARVARNSVQRRLAFGPCLPAPMHPEPLVGITPNDVFDDFGELSGVGDDVGLVVVVIGPN